MNARDELAEVIYKARWVDAVENAEMATDAKMAETILAAGWVKPRTITTVEELDALPLETVVKSADGNVWECLVGGWYETCSRARHASSDIALPAIVLHEPV